MRVLIAAAVYVVIASSAYAQGLAQVNLQFGFDQGSEGDDVDRRLFFGGVDIEAISPFGLRTDVSYEDFDGPDGSTELFSLGLRPYTLAVPDAVIGAVGEVTTGEIQGRDVDGGRFGLEALYAPTDVFRLSGAGGVGELDGDTYTYGNVQAQLQLGQFANGFGFLSVTDGDTFGSSFEYGAGVQVFPWGVGVGLPAGLQAQISRVETDFGDDTRFSFGIVFQTGPTKGLPASRPGPQVPVSRTVAGDFSDGRPTDETPTPPVTERPGPPTPPDPDDPIPQ